MSAYRPAGGFRFKVDGRCDSRRLIEAAEILAAKLEEFGITDYRGLNIYLTPLDADGQPVVLEGPDGQEVPGLVLQDPVKPKRVRAKRKSAEILPFRSVG